MRKQTGLFFAFALGWGLLAGSSRLYAQIDLPRLGYVFDAMAREILPITGIPGAAVAGPALPAGVRLANAEISAAHDYALAVDDSAVLLVRWKGGRMENTVLPSPVPDRMVMSPRGSSAALFHSAEAELRIWSGLPEKPFLRRTIGPLAMGAPGVIAISDDGETIIAARPHGGATVFTGGGREFDLPAAGAVHAISFRAGRPEALLAADHLIYLCAGWDGAPQCAAVAAADEPPAAIACSGDGSRLYLASPKARAVRIIDLPRGVQEDVPCNCRVSRLLPLQGDSVFLLESCGPGIRILDHNGAMPRTLFVPHTAEPVN